MRLFALSRLSTCALLCLCLVLLVHCGGAAKDELHGTQTGSPPAVDPQKLRLVANASGVELIAEAGAVSGGAEVRLANRSTGATAVVTASADGSFRVAVMGTPLDTFDVTMTHMGGTVTLQLSVATTEDASTPGGELGALSCEQLEAGLYQRLNATFAPFAQGCTSNIDCKQQYYGVGCYYQCGSSYIVAERQEEAIAAAEQSVAPVCSELERRCVRQPPSSCPLPPQQPIECYQGWCRALDVASLSCDGLQTRARELATDTTANVARSCTDDEDCTFVTLPALSCASSCPFSGSVTTTAADAMRQSIERIENSLCGAHGERECPPPEQAPCAAPPAQPVVACIDSLCSLR